MARVDPVPPEKAGWLQKLAERQAKKKRGKDFEVFGIMGHHGLVLGAYGGFEMALERMRRLPGRLKSLASIKAATLIGCPF